MLQLSLAEDTSGLCDKKLRLDFDQRTTSLTQEMMEFLLGMPRLSFRDIARDGNRRSPQLIRNSETLFRWKPVRRGVDFQYELHRLLPRDQVSIRLPHKVSVPKYRIFESGDL